MSRGALRGVKWHRLVCDEAAFIKNLDTQRAKAVHRLKKSHVWLATGSPVQNNIKELQTLLRLCKFSGAKHKTHLYIIASFYQDRLGTNIGKTPKNASFSMPFHAKNASIYHD
jgi:SNF2 family DNA or RNA helicase